VLPTATTVPYLSPPSDAADHVTRLGILGRRQLDWCVDHDAAEILPDIKAVACFYVGHR
jgi:hypothetical protein